MEQAPPLLYRNKNPDAFNVGTFYRYTASGGIYVLRYETDKVYFSLRSLLSSSIKVLISLN